MIDYKKIWASINAESKNNSGKIEIARKIPSDNAFSVFLATDFRKGIRLLYIKLDIDHEIITDNLPTFRGLEISLSNTPIGGIRDAGFIKFTQSIPNTDNIFELVISDICDNIIKLENKNYLKEILIKVLNEWKLFFEENENEILSIESQTGLVGELNFLRDYLFGFYSKSDSLLFWTGSDRTNHDFQIGSNAVEVKSTTIKQHKKMFISSERQLDNTGLDNLFIAFYTFNLHDNISDYTLPTLVREICSLLENNPVELFNFEVKLAKYGYNDIHAKKYTKGFSFVEIKFFKVIDGFPRLLHNNLPKGVGDLNYSVVVSACLPFEIKTDILKKIIY